MEAKWRCCFSSAVRLDAVSHYGARAAEFWVISETTLTEVNVTLTQVHIKIVHFVRLPNDTFGLAAELASTRSAAANYSNEVCLSQMNKKKFGLKY